MIGNADGDGAIAFGAHPFVAFEVFDIGGNVAHFLNPSKNEVMGDG
jgi:hypothetical protein